MGGGIYKFCGNLEEYAILIIGLEGWTPPALVIGIGTLQLKCLYTSSFTKLAVLQKYNIYLLY